MLISHAFMTTTTTMINNKESKKNQRSDKLRVKKLKAHAHKIYVARCYLKSESVMYTTAVTTFDHVCAGEALKHNKR